MVRRMATEPKAALAGVMLETSFARFSASMAMSNEDRKPSGPFGCWDLVAMVETQGRLEKVMQRTGCEGESES